MPTSGAAAGQTGPLARALTEPPVSVSIVESRAAAVVANERAREWVGANMADLIADPPEVTMGEMLVDAATHDEAAEPPAPGRDVPHDALD
jgi:hypothetical protein